MAGRIVTSGGPELADELERTGYEGLAAELGIDELTVGRPFPEADPFGDPTIGSSPFADPLAWSESWSDRPVRLLRRRRVVCGFVVGDATVVRSSVSSRSSAWSAALGAVVVVVGGGVGTGPTYPLPGCIGVPTTYTDSPWCTSVWK